MDVTWRTIYGDTDTCAYIFQVLWHVLRCAFASYATYFVSFGGEIDFHDRDIIFHEGWECAFVRDKINVGLSGSCLDEVHGVSVSANRWVERTR